VLTIEQAQKKMLSALRPLPAQRVALQDALGRVSAADIFSAEDLVPFARSAMDGFAVRAADTDGASPASRVKLAVAGSAYAEAGKQRLARNTAIAISTGAAIPIGADAVIPIENVTVRQGVTEISKAISAGDCVFPAGEDVKRGERITARGEILRAGQIGLLAFAGNAKVHVYRRPRVNILATGNELVDIGAKPRHGQIRNSNAQLLCSLAREAGADARFVGVAPDNPERLKAMLRSTRRGADVIVTTGGASRGERDYLKAAFAELGAEILINQVAMRPGRPMGFAMWRGIPACILPGNPAAAFVCWQLFVRAAISLMGGRAEPIPARVTARLTKPIHGRSGVEYAVFARARFRGAGVEITPLENQCSSLVRTAVEANALAIVPPGEDELRAGDLIEVQFWRGELG
jgi:molybdopterin molybdotransferase